MTEKKFEQAMERFFGGFPLSIQLLASFTFAVIFLFIGYRMLKRSKRIAGYIFVGLGILTLVWKIIETLPQILF